MKRLLITGATGFIGSFLTDEALKRSYDVYAGIRKTSSTIFLTDPRIRFVELDLSDKAQIKNTLQKLTNENQAPDYVIHNAGVTQAARQKDYFKVNTVYTRNLIEALIESNLQLKKFIYTSSLAAFGPGDPHSLTPINDTDKPSPVTAYGRSKLEAENYIKTLRDFPFLIIRPTAVYGPREKNLFVAIKLLSKGWESYIGSKEQMLSFIFIKDLIDVYFKALKSPIVQNSYFACDGNAYNIVEFNNIIKQELKRTTTLMTFPIGLVKTIAAITGNFSRLTGRVSILNTDKVNELKCLNWLCNVEPLKKDLQFEPKFDLKAGMHETLKWYKLYKWL